MQFRGRLVTLAVQRNQPYMHQTGVPKYDRMSQNIQEGRVLSTRRVNEHVRQSALLVDR